MIRCQGNPGFFHSEAGRSQGLQPLGSEAVRNILLDGELVFDVNSVRDMETIKTP